MDLQINQLVTAVCRNGYSRFSKNGKSSAGNFTYLYTNPLSLPPLTTSGGTLLAIFVKRQQMIRNLILVFIIALSQSIIGQTEKDSLMAKMKVLEPELDYIVQDFESNLRSKGVQLICSYGINSGEGWHTFNLEKARENPCVMLDERTVYIFWVEDKKTFATKFDTCNNFPIVNISESHAWEFYLRNEKLIQVEKSKLFQFNDGNKIIGTSEDHQSEREFFFMNKEEKFKVRFYYDHRFEESYDKKTNINFEYNRNLKSKQMMDLLNEMAKDFDNKNLIGSKRQNGK